ncbi:hypothetical protein SASPL_157305 [Salvia splendens]|uniref:Uncharacterized protein n=1 Tax=Salvia splendens TaxID=180675 RepID=A0A8X8YUF1_SALSN|nr:hypothetical protein SASPL_157305 [Salvia splendens]
MASIDPKTSLPPPPPPGPLNNAELTEELFGMRSRYAGQDKKLSQIQFDLKVYMHKQDAQTRKIEESLAFLINASQRTPKELLDPRSAPTRRWALPKSVVENRSKPTAPALVVQQQRPLTPQLKPGVPIIKVSAAERADRARRGLCYWCPEKYTREHVCSKKFYALMGEDDEEDAPFSEEPDTGDEGENMVITGDVSSIHVIGPQIKPRAIRLMGRINGYEVSVLIDSGSTHNFIQPTVAEKLSLHVHPISPFRVFVGNGESLRCSYACLQTPISLQGNHFDIDLFILQVKGPDIILGVQWLQELGDVTKNYRDLTMRFNWADHSVFLRGDGANPRQISYNNLFALVGQEPDCEIFELVATGPTTTLPEPLASAPAMDPVITRVLESFDSIFSVASDQLPTAFRNGHPLDTPRPSSLSSSDAFVEYSLSNLQVAVVETMKKGSSKNEDITVLDVAMEVSNLLSHIIVLDVAQSTLSCSLFVWEISTSSTTIAATSIAMSTQPLIVNLDRDTK